MQITFKDFQSSDAFVDVSGNTSLNIKKLKTGDTIKQVFIKVKEVFSDANALLASCSVVITINGSAYTAQCSVDGVISDNQDSITGNAMYTSDNNVEFSNFGADKFISVFIQPLDANSSPVSVSTLTSGKFLVEIK